VSVARPTSFAVVHAGDFFVNSIEARVGADVIAAKASRGESGRTLDELLIRFDRPLPGGNAKISFDYNAPFAQSDDPRGLFRRREPSGWYAFTEFEPCGAREMLPSFDEPSFKVPFDVTVTVPPPVAADDASVLVPVVSPPEPLVTTVLERPLAPPVIAGFTSSK
jgi:alanyl aminopeptidase